MKYNYTHYFEQEILKQEQNIKKVKSKSFYEIITDEEKELIKKYENEIKIIKQSVWAKVKDPSNKKLMLEIEKLDLLIKEYQYAPIKFHKLNSDNASLICKWVVKILEELEGEKYTAVKGLVDNEEIVFVFMPYKTFKKTSLKETDISKIGEYSFTESSDNQKYSLCTAFSIFRANYNYEYDNEENEIEKMFMGNYRNSEKQKSCRFLWDFLDVLRHFKIENEIYNISETEIEEIYNSMLIEYSDFLKNNNRSRIRSFFKK